MPPEALLIFIKNPEPGKVKTRLARTVGDERALAIYHSLLAHTRAIALAVDVDRLLFYSPVVIAGDDWPTDRFQKFQQEGADLGERMARAFDIALLHYDRAVIIGADCASLTPGIVRRSFRALDTHDCVLGPTYDGGYYLLGMKISSPTLFSNIRWSTGQVLSTTRERLRSAGLSWFELPTLSDIDTEEDWVAHGWEV